MFEKTFYREFLKRSFNIPIQVTYWNGKTEQYGDGDPRAHITFKEEIPIKDITNNASIALGEAYMDGKIEIDGNIEELINSAYENASTSFLGNKKFAKLMPKKTSHSVKNNKEDIQKHYDIGNDFYKLWLDKTMTYSCAYFESPEDDLETAQMNKIRHIIQKLDPKPGETLLDIGCGWGTLMLTAAKEFNLKVYGITLSKDQYNYLNDKIQEEGLEDVAKVQLKDYREINKGEQYDHVVSVGMFEHVGKDNLNEYFEYVNKYLKPNGIALIHGITRQQGGATNGWIDKWIFPGGYVPGLNENLGHIINNGMQIVDLESLRRHYQKTLETWDHNFNQQIDKVRDMFDEEFVRMWDLYLQACAASFKSGNIDVMQYLITKGPSGKQLPMTREYMYNDNQDQ